MGQEFKGDIVLGSDSSLFFMKADGTLKEVLRMDTSDNVSLINVDALSVSLIPTTTNTDDLGSSSKKFKDLYLAGNASVGGTLGVTGAVTLSSTLGAGASTLGATTTTTLGVTGDLTVTSGNAILATAGKGLKIKEGSNARMGTATLSSGTVTVSNTSVTANTRILVSRYSSNSSTALGILSVGTVVANTSFVINALKEADATVQTNDASIVHWVLIEPSP